MSTVDAAHFSAHFRPPLYESYNFCHIPDTIYRLFTGKAGGLPEDTLVDGRYKQVVLLLIDAFGWAFFERYKEQIPFFRIAKQEGVCSKLTSLFPSTTSAHVTCIASGLLPIQSGIYEWFMYEPTLDQIIAPLPFNYPGQRDHSTLPLDPGRLLPQTTFFHRLAQEGISSRTYQPQSIAASTYSQTVFSGSTICGYTSVEEGFHLLLEQLQEGSYAFFYYPEVDAIGHRTGVHSEPFAAAIVDIFSHIDQLRAQLPQDTALLITADHGMVDVDPKQTLYLNQIDGDIQKFLQVGRSGRPLVPAGSCRDFFLHVQPGHILELQRSLQLQLEGKAEVWQTKELLSEGMFSPLPATDHFLKRVGDLVILPFQGEAVWWLEKGRFQQHFYGAHGGMSPQEMDIPFLFFPL